MGPETRFGPFCFFLPLPSAATSPPCHHVITWTTTSPPDHINDTAKTTPYHTTTSRRLRQGSEGQTNNGRVQQARDEQWESSRGSRCGSCFFFVNFHFYCTYFHVTTRFYTTMGPRRVSGPWSFFLATASLPPNNIPDHHFHNLPQHVKSP
jgi:hypothetical protein